VTATRPDSAVALTPGDRLLPGYEVISHLSRGRQLDVYEVWSAERQCSCVAKTLRPDCEGRDRARRRLLQEGRLLRSLTHPHIVRAYETIEAPRLTLILETLDGETLEHMLARRGRLALEEVRCLGLHLCSAVSYLHRHGYLHVDLKPSNVVSECGVAKLIDLSLARLPGPAPAGIGTRAYLSPEQARGGLLGRATDVWGIGAVLHEAITGERAFESREDGYAQLDARAEPVRARRRRVPRALAEAIDACLDPEPERRPRVRKLAAALGV
jgi:eukaryotic-like serine/threonine-protein kinase